MPLPPVMTLEDVGAYLQISRSTVDRLIKSGKLRSYLVSPQRRRVKQEWLLEYEAQLITESQQITG